MKRYLRCTIALLLYGFTVRSQNLQLHVEIRDDKQSPVQNATVSLFQLPDSSLKFRKVVSADVNIPVNSQTNYLLKILVVGMETHTRNLFIADSSINIPVVLHPVVGNLGGVTVVSKKPLVKQEDDKTIVEAEPLANSSTNAYEVLEKTPGAIVDQDGNVYLNSTIPATVYINGREMKLSSADLTSLLKSLPAGSVSKIEILRTPSAKYDAASSGGIINIVLKKGVKLGTSGSANIAYFQGVYATQTAGVSINHGTGKVNSYLSYQFTRRNNFEELNSDRFISRDTSLLTQRSYTTYPYVNNYISAGTDIAFTKKFNLSYDARFSYNRGNSYAVNAIDITNGLSNNLLGKNESDINNSNKSTYFSNNINSKYKIDSLGSEWTAQVDYSYYSNNNGQDYKNLSYLPFKNPVSGDGSNLNRKNILTAQTDLTLKFPEKFTVEAGAKFSFSNSNNSSAYFKDTGNNNRFVDVYQTNTFRYKETVGAVYLQASKTIWGFTIKPGVRLELTDINGRQTVPKDTVLSIRRTDVFPYVYLKHNLFRIFNFPSMLVANIVIRKSIKRPYYEILNPYPRYVDQYLFDAGNPKLKPQFTTNYELNITYEDIPVIAVGINDTKDIFSNVTYQDPVTKIAYRTWDNLGKNKEIYARLVGGLPPGGKFFFYLGGQYNYNKYEGFYQGLPLNYKRGSWTFFMFQEWKLARTLTVNMQGFIRTKGLQNLYELNTFGGMFVSANKSFLKKKLNVILSVNDLLRTNHVSFKLQQGDVNANGERINDTRRIGLTIRYSFGIKPKEEKKANFEGPSDGN